MDTHRVEIQFAFPRLAAQSVEHLNHVIEELTAIGVTGGVLFDQDRRYAALVLDMPGDDHADAVHRAFTAARTAIHAAGGATPGWEATIARVLESLDFSR